MGILTGRSRWQVLLVLVALILLIGACDWSPFGPAPAPDDAWERIQEAGKIVVGTSASYPPFEYYAGGRFLDRFDLPFFDNLRKRRLGGFVIALMNAIGEHLDLEVDYRDMAFEGLSDALFLGEIDVAIAAISVTPEREAYVDFSDVYLFGADAVLAGEDSAIEAVDAVDDMVGHRVGVERGSVYESWLHRELVETGEMPSRDLFTYGGIADAVDDLREDFIDLVVLDAQPAEAEVADGGVEIVGRGLNLQLYAIALPKGDLSLKAEIDGALQDLKDEGVIADLAREYLNLDALLPPPTPGPTSTPGPAPSCADGMAFVDYVGQSGDPITNPPTAKPGEAFTWTWRVKNTGTCTWDSGYRVVYVTGSSAAARMGGQPAAVQGTVAPGGTYDLDVNLVAPLQPGTYVGVWQMENGRAQGFGERLLVAAQVQASPTATPRPTQTPSADIRFTVDRTSIKRGECVTFAWDVQNVKEVYFYAEGEDWRQKGVAGKGSQVECPPDTTTYYLRVVKRDGTVEVPSITIYVEPVVGAPDITRFTVDPPNQITLGQCVTLRWEVQGTVSTVRLADNWDTLWEGAPTKGTYQDCPGAAAAVSYLLEAVGPGGTSRASQTVYVVDAATATPVPTAAPESPVIYSFSVLPVQVAAGGCVNIAWSAGGGTTYTRLLRDRSVVLDDAGFQGHQQDCLATAGQYTYRLEASNAADEMAFREQAVTVTGAAEENPLAGTRWTATAVNRAPVISGTTLTASFGAAGTLDGSAGCNSYSATYGVSGRQIAITPPMTSSMLCQQPAGIMEQEQAYLAALTSAGAYTLEGDQLYLEDAAGQVLLAFVSVAR